MVYLQGWKRRDLANNLRSSSERNKTEFFVDIPEDVDSDDEYKGPLKKPRNVED